ncbi:MAG: MBOAT family protein [Acidimicrobiia bacterium]|nr:MBOAT family protein [Acidimicrobiia bacterium]
MVFSSPIFLTVFLPIVLATTLIVPRRFRNVVLLAASLGFYYWGAGPYILVLAWVVAVSFLAAQRLESRSNFALAIVAILGPLLWFKYSAFFSDIALDVASVVGVDGTPWDARILPVGISFFTFQALSYVFDVRRGAAEPLDRGDRYLLYIALFPQLIAGPIVRYSEIRDQLYERVITLDRLAVGATRFAHGLAKKVIIADSVAPIADAAFASGDLRPSIAAWIGLLAYTVQIYFDFSGYSDMAIGLGTMFGFTFPENFARPYSSSSITEFWRRWHITLSSWFRDYVYIPLGGSRNGDAATYRNLIIIFFLTALWHGAAWTFLVWGGLHGAWLIVERVTGLGSAAKAPVLRRILTLLIVMVAWVFFRAPTVGDAADYVVDLFAFSGGTISADLITAMTVPSMLMLAVGVASFFLPKDWVAGPRITRMDAEGLASTAFRPVLARGAYVMVALPICMAFIAANDFSPFLYFQF